MRPNGGRARARAGRVKASGCYGHEVKGARQTETQVAYVAAARLKLVAGLHPVGSVESDSVGLIEITAAKRRDSAHSNVQHATQSVAPHRYATLSLRGTRRPRAFGADGPRNDARRCITASRMRRSCTAQA